MKVLLGCLMCLVLTIAQTLAISGGPWGGRGGQVTVTGTYAGVLVPVVVVVDPGPPPVTLPPDNSLALFTLKIPQTGGAAGVAIVFRNGITYVGTILGIADPDSAKLTGIITTAFLLKLGTGSSSADYEYDANGQFVNAKIVGGTNASGAASTRIRGKATLTYVNDDPDPMRHANGDSGGPIQYKIHGFKQSESSS
jgi:hypothetical protein